MTNIYKARCNKCKKVFDIKYNDEFNYSFIDEVCNCKDEFTTFQVLSDTQKEIIKEKCPHCNIGELHEVDGEYEQYLWCNNCDCSVDSDGGYTF